MADRRDRHLGAGFFGSPVDCPAAKWSTGLSSLMHDSCCRGAAIREAGPSFQEEGLVRLHFLGPVMVRKLSWFAFPALFDPDYWEVRIVTPIT
jgi:hypothetical protein